MTSNFKKIVIVTFFLMTIQPIQAFTQKQYYGDTQQTTSCPCETVNPFKGSRYEGVMRPISPNCVVHKTVIDTVPEGFYLLKRPKKKPQPTYPKTSSIIRL